uniref:Uncharacterized protein n=1 Tax=Setaria digitata TaxID=48799 RepID=A0A915PLR9_9BILA
MKKTKKRVKFELPNRTDNATTTTTTTRAAQPTFQLEMLPEVKTSPHLQLCRNSSMQRKIRSHIRSALPVPYNSSVLHHPSSMTTGSRRSMAAIYPATDNKINSYLTRSKASYDTFPISQAIKPYVNPRNTYADRSIFRSTQITLQLTNLYAKTPPIDVTRKFCTTYPEKQRYFTTTSKSMLLSTMKPSDKEPFGRLSALISPSTSSSSSNPNNKMGLLHLCKIVSESPRYSFFPDRNIPRKRGFAWVSMKI